MDGHSNERKWKWIIHVWVSVTFLWDHKAPGHHTRVISVVFLLYFFGGRICARNLFLCPSVCLPLTACLYLSSEDLGGCTVCHLASETDTKSFGCDLFELMVQNIVGTPHTQRQFRRRTGPIQMAHGIPPRSTHTHTYQARSYSHQHARTLTEVPPLPIATNYMSHRGCLGQYEVW